MTGLTPHRRKLRVLLALVLLFGAVAVGFRVQRTGEVSHDFSGASPDWIWDSGWSKAPVRAHAFTVEKQFEAPEVPDTARLLILADEEYHLNLNGKWVGSGRFRRDSGWDSYSAVGWVLEGGNTLRVELRSGRGAGGLLVCLQAAPGEPCWIRSESSWQVVPQKGESRPVQVWGASPVGSWNLPTAVKPRRSAAECVLADRPVEARRFFAVDDKVLRSRDQEMPIPVWTVRWGIRTRAIIEIDVDPEERRLGELAFGRNRRRPAAREILETLVTEPGQSTYRSVVSREFRFVEIDGIKEVLGGRYYKVREECDDWFFQPTEAEEGLLGLDPPPSRTPVQNELRGKL